VSSGDEDIRRLDVALGDVLLVRCVQPIRHLNGDLQQGIDL
jgi:hypothetical protein